MAKLDITNVPRELDEFIAASGNPRHRQIAEVVRRHYLLELTGHGDELFAEDMMAENPLYYMNINGLSITLRGTEEVRAFYESQHGVMLAATDVTQVVNDYGYWTECQFNWYLTGAALAAQGAEVSSPDATYIKKSWISMYWPFDDQARMRGEHIYEHLDVAEIIPIPPEDFITLEYAQKTLTPLLRALPVYTP
ncbi:hypothetical protein Aple_035760 [Acrocarpospora pleiomorpha]|uniref:SnoaL-like domain-containing protein n=1 Tax=Acrocarpospora pleiomorpha TaxID=90975 RepID=A0A5M3XIA1_9ACTN|nr:hypothetical protein [Acrocarpospora pleiomorpha]GES20680.1 hypothetical protein Aple_035760 [Acrocarpospora pleiomorpha]